MDKKTASIISRFTMGDMEIVYIADERKHTGLAFVPACMADKAEYSAWGIESLVQLHMRGDNFATSFQNGHSLSNTQSTHGFAFDSQSVTEDEGATAIATVLTDGLGHKLTHLLTRREGLRAFEVKVTFENLSGEPVLLENLSSFAFGGLTPFGDVRATDRMKLHRARSWWSAEGRVESGTLEDYHMEPSWSRCGVRVEKFGQVGSMPVRRYFPFVALEDAAAGVTWAAQLACASSWQMELRRQGDGLSVTGGLADYEFGHWTKTVQPGDSFTTPAAYLTVGKGGLDEVSQRLLDLHEDAESLPGDDLPVVFNEFCTTWGNPSEENIGRIMDIMRGRGVDYFVIDAGWYGDGDWGKVGDWVINGNMFPNGLQSAVKRITDAGMKPGIWFEMENCTGISNVSKNPGWTLTRHGTPISTGNRMFLDLKNPEVRDYLREKVIGLLSSYGFRYIKVDYNDTIGVGCDDPDGLGEGLRKSILASQEFFREIHRGVPGIVIENCSSGGHRLEPSMMNLCDMASFSDAHECVQIPIIAANLHRLIKPGKSQIWAVLRKDDPLRRTNYSMVNTLLGVMCISGDVYDLSPEQWAIVDRAIAFYRKYSHIIKRGASSFYGDERHSYGSPEGWQAVARRNDAGETLLVVHTFGGELPSKVRIPVDATRIADVLCSEGNAVALADGCVEVEIKANFEAIAVALN